MTTNLLPGLSRASLEISGDRLAGDELAGAVGAVAASLGDRTRVALWCTSELETGLGIAGALSAGVTVVPINPASGDRELAHETGDSRPEAVLASAAAELPPTLAALPRIVIDPTTRAPLPSPDLDPDAAALIVYTSGTTGAPKGVVLSRRAVAANLDALADAWAWTDADVVTHALPLFHVHGLVLGTVGPLRLGGGVRHVGRFSPEAIAAALADDATMLFAVPTMHGRLLAAAEQDPAVASALRSARLIVSGSAALPARVHEAYTAATGQQIVERYGMSEALMIASARHDGPRIPGAVGTALPGVEIRITDDAGAVIPAGDTDAIGNVEIKSASLFDEYLGRPDATAEAFRDGWFCTGDVGSLDHVGVLRLVGRSSTDLIKTGGYRVGAGEIEAAMLEHPDVVEVAVLGIPDDDLGERIAAWVVIAPDSTLTDDELVQHVAELLAPHKRPRAIIRVDELPRNALGKVQKKRLVA
ncbi:MAG: AMP-binding protein [Gaiellales bacterium]